MRPGENQVIDQADIEASGDCLQMVGCLKVLNAGAAVSRRMVMRHQKLVRSQIHGAPEQVPRAQEYLSAAPPGHGLVTQVVPAPIDEDRMETLLGAAAQDGPEILDQPRIIGLDPRALQLLANRVLRQSPRGLKNLAGFGNFLLRKLFQIRAESASQAPERVDQPPCQARGLFAHQGAKEVRHDL